MNTIYITNTMGKPFPKSNTKVSIRGEVGFPIFVLTIMARREFVLVTMGRKTLRLT